MSGTLEELRSDENLIDMLGELYAGEGRTYADELRAVQDWPSAWRILVRAASTARICGDYYTAEGIRGVVGEGRYHRGLEEGRAIAKLARA
jgi:hypothetical protein